MASIRKRKYGPNKDREAWVVDYVDQHGKRRLKTFPNKKSAEVWKVNALHEVRQGTHTPASRWRSFIITAIFTGMRLGELRGLRWGDLDLDAGLIHVRQRASQWMQIGPPKSKAGKRDIPLAPIVVNTLRQWRLVCPKGSLDLVFPNTIGHIDSVQGIHARFWVPLQVKCGLTADTGKTRYSFHMLRHAAASLFIKYLGWSPKRLQAVMGHASISMTFDRYGHLFESAESDRADMEKIERAVRAS